MKFRSRDKYPTVKIGEKMNNKSRSWLWKIPLGVVLLLLLCLAVASLSINSIALNQINRVLTTYLIEGGSLKGIDIGLMAGRVELTGVTINPPKGHGTDALLSVGNVVVDVVPTSLLSDVIVVEEVFLKGMSLNLVRDKQGRVGLTQLINAGEPAVDLNTAGKQPDAAGKAESPTRERSLPVVQVDQIRLEDGSLTLQDSALTGKPMVFPLKDIRLRVDQLCLFDENKAADPAAVSFSFQLKQPGNLPDAYFGAVATVGPIAGGIPPINAQVRLIGLKLDTLGSLIPPATRSALGADGLDAGYALALNAGHITLDALVLTDRNIRYDTIRVRGRLDAPVVDIAPVMSGMFRVTDGMLNIGMSGLGAGISIAEGGFNVVKEVGSGSLRMGKKLLGGLFDTGTGIATLDAEKMGKGIADSTAGTINLSLEHVMGAGSAAGSGLGQSASELTGKSALKAWDKSIPERYQTAMRRAEAALEKMPYPPVTR